MLDVSIIIVHYGWITLKNDFYSNLMNIIKENYESFLKTFCDKIGKLNWFENVVN